MLKSLIVSLTIILVPLASAAIAQEKSENLDNLENIENSQCSKSNTITGRTRYLVQNYIMSQLVVSRFVDKQQLDAIIGFQGCLQAHSYGRSLNVFVYRWEAEDGKAIEARWHKDAFQTWKGENF